MKRSYCRSSFVLSVFILLISASMAWALADRRFDVTTIDNTPDGSNPHFTLNMLVHLNFATANGHFCCMSTDAQRATLNDAGNFLAVYYNTLQDLFTEGYNGDQAADQIQNYIVANDTTTGSAPQWVVLNEISRGAWDANTVGSAGVAYHNWLIGCCERLQTLYNHQVILFSPYILPTTSGSDWTFLSQKCYIAIEGYLSGSVVNGSGNSVSFCQGKYQSYVDAYHALGVPYSKLYLTEHYSQTTSGTAYGRAGVSYAGWDNAIRTRASAIHNIFVKGDIGGYISYGWDGNPMGVSGSRHDPFRGHLRLDSAPIIVFHNYDVTELTPAAMPPAPPAFF